VTLRFIDQGKMPRAYNALGFRTPVEYALQAGTAEAALPMDDFS
jgi:hypothetical protein